MKSSRLNDQQIIAILKQHESGIPVADLCREHNIGNSTFYKWRAKYGGMDASMICLLYTSPSPRDRQKSRMPSSA